MREDKTMMLVDRYVDAVRRELPRGQRNDIAAELRDTLLSQIEEAETAQGRPATDDEVAAILKRYGAPDVVAAKYGAPRTYLIGPEIYPQYRAVVRAILLLIGGVTFAAIAGTAVNASRPLPQIARIALTGLVVALGNVAIMTALFARLERLAVAPRPADWDPRELLPAPLRAGIPRAEAIGSLLVATFGLLWWVDVLPINRWLLWSRLPLAAAPIWETLTPLIVTLMIASIGLAAVALLRPRWTMFYEIGERLLDVGIGVMIVLALRAPALIVATDPKAAGANLRHLLEWVVTLGLYAWGLLVVFSVATSAWRYAAGWRPRLSDQLV